MASTVTPPGLAYGILCHSDFVQLDRLLWAIWSPGNLYVLHVDKAVPTAARNRLQRRYAGLGNVYFLDSRSCSWGGFSLVEASLDAVELALALDPDWQTFLLISGAHLPLRPQAEIAERLAAEGGASLLDMEPLDLGNETFASRVANRFHEDRANKVVRMLGPRDELPDWAFRRHAQWVVLSRAHAERLVSPDRFPFVGFFRETLVPDEMFFATTLCELGLAPLVERAVTFQKWDGSASPGRLAGPDYLAGVGSDALFARKFGDRVDDAVVAHLDDRVASLSYDRFADLAGFAGRDEAPPVAFPARPFLDEIADDVEAGALAMLNDRSASGFVAWRYAPDGRVAQLGLRIADPAAFELLPLTMIVRAVGRQSASVGLYVPESVDWPAARAGLPGSLRSAFAEAATRISTWPGWCDVLAPARRSAGLLLREDSLVPQDVLERIGEIAALLADCYRALALPEPAAAAAG